MGKQGGGKVFLLLEGKPLWRWSLEAFARSGEVSMVLLVGPDQATLGRMLTEARAVVDGTIEICGEVGGKERQDSVWAGLEQIPGPDRLVAIHDTARPLIQAEQIRALFALARREGASVLARPVTDTIKQVGSGDTPERATALRDLNRNTLWAMETPQIFPLEGLRAAYQEVIRDNHCITDDVAAWSYAGGKVAILPNEYPNPKLTYQEDWHYLNYLRQGKRPQNGPE